MQDTEKTVCFKHEGKVYHMTNTEFEAAYRYKEHQYQLMDAKRHIDQIVFGAGYDNPLELPDEKIKECKKDFLGIYKVTYEQATELRMLEKYVNLFNTYYDCNICENVIWEESIKKALGYNM